MNKLKPLIKNQTIRIDNHSRGCNLPNDFNDERQDVHIHKEFNKIEGKRNKICIKIPLNTEKQVEISSYAPTYIIKEIREVLNDKKNRDSFLNDVYGSLKNDWKWDATPENQGEIATRIANAFGLNIVSEVRLLPFSRLTEVIYFMQDEERKELFKMRITKNNGFCIQEVDSKRGNIIKTPFKR